MSEILFGTQVHSEWKTITRLFNTNNAKIISGHIFETIDYNYMYWHAYLDAGVEAKYDHTYYPLCQIEL